MMLRALGTVCLIAILCAAAGAGPAAAADKPCKPNIVLILVDDQDPDLNTTHPAYMPKLNKWFVEGGVEIKQHRINTPICCPSRATLLSGRHVHNTNFTDLFPPHGGYTYWKLSKQEAMGYFPTWLQDSGYYTSYIGKLFMEYGIYNYNLKPRGFNHTDLLAYPWVFDYDHPVFSLNSASPRHYWRNYSTDVIAEKAVAEIRKAAQLAKQGIPFHLSVAPTACHDWMNWKDTDLGGPGKLLGPPLAPERYKNLFAGVMLPKKANFMEANETFQYKAKWLRSMHPSVLKNTAFLNEYYRRRLRALRAADDMVDVIMSALQQEGILEDTYVFYTSDNGYHIGAHRMHAGKESPFEEDTRVPMFVRGPGIKGNQTDAVSVSSHVDFPATWVTLAGADYRKLPTDGQPMPLHRWAEEGKESYFEAFKAYKQYESVPVEYWGPMSDQLTDRLQVPLNIQKNPAAALLYPTVPELLYKVIRADVSDRIKGEPAKIFKYIVSCGMPDDDRELYDLTNDPDELYNLFFFNTTHHTPKELRRIKNRMDALISAGYACINYTACIAPFGNLNASIEGWPEGAPLITSLAQSLEPMYDSFFEQYGEGDNRFKWVFKAPPDTKPHKNVIKTGCLDRWQWDNEAGAFDAYPWVKAAVNPHFVVDWGTFTDTASVDATNPIALAKLAIKSAALRGELVSSNTQPDYAAMAQAAAAAAAANARENGAVGPAAWPGTSGQACSILASAAGGRKLLMAADLHAVEAPVEKFGRVLTQREIDDTVAWMQRRIKTHPHELKHFR